MALLLMLEKDMPISVEGDSYCIQKVYQLSLSDDPSAIPTEDYEWDGRLNMSRKNEVGVDTLVLHRHFQQSLCHWLHGHG